MEILHTLSIDENDMYILTGDTSLPWLNLTQQKGEHVYLQEHEVYQAIPNFDDLNMLVIDDLEYIINTLAQYLPY